MSRFKKIKLKKILLILISLIIAVFILRLPIVHSFLLNLGNLGYLGVFIAGILFVSTFTVATGIAILMIFTQTLTPIEVGVVAGLGAVIGDYIIFKFVKSNLSSDVGKINERVESRNDVAKVFYSKYFSWTLPVLGAIIIALPIPDEIGVSLMGISRMKTYQFLLTSFILNAIGIFLVVSAGVLILE